MAASTNLSTVEVQRTTTTQSHCSFSTLCRSNIPARCLCRYISVASVLLSQNRSDDCLRHATFAQPIFSPGPRYVRLEPTLLLSVVARTCFVHGAAALINIQSSQPQVQVATCGCAPL